MNKLIEWEDFNNGNSSSGSVGEPKIALIEKIHPEHGLYRVIVLGCLFGELSSSPGEAKAKAEELLAEWMKQAKLVEINCMYLQEDGVCFVVKKKAECSFGCSACVIKQHEGYTDE